ncbi:uncharacterized protein BX664DRAFT_267842 [Halteromyces radiatus]|uniref:uncharacterized protein n=1 Tax=Halteromyces radiatus TaxID=101107 RepID=UPI00221F8454|nr:uncharacterized protein BX664DRAFT_267842 [Halteromyces radiatus]KAI8082804.1 hypothetical protein BX664DRAFT_267842 [Halteromyces radiatus]
MRLPTLSSLGLFVLATAQFVSAQQAEDSQIDAYTPQAYSDYYLSAFGDEEEPEAEFELVEGHVDIPETPVELIKRAECTKYHTVSGNDNCINLSKKYGIKLDQFYSWNPQVNNKCTNLNNGKKYCVATGSGSKVSSNKSSQKKKSSSKRPSTSKSSSGKKEKRKLLQSNTAFTYYWIATPDSYKSGGKSVTIKTCSGKSLGKVSENYGDALVMEGTGVLGSKIVNLGGCSCSNYKCFEEVDKHDDPYGLTAGGSPLRPYVTIAANDFKRGTKIYVPQLVGWSLPGTSKKHNGCLLVDDQSWSFGSHHIDFYIYKQKNYKTLDKQHRITKVDIYDGGSCTLLNYL